MAAPASFLAMPAPLNSAMAYSTSRVGIVGEACLREQAHGLGHVLLHAAALLIKSAERILGVRVAGIGGDAQQIGGARKILRKQLPFDVEEREIVSGKRVTELGGGGKQLGALLAIARTGAAFKAKHRQRKHGIAVAAVGGELVPFGGLFIVLWHSLAVGVEHAEHGHGLGIVILSGAMGGEPEGGQKISALVGVVDVIDFSGAGGSERADEEERGKRKHHGELRAGMSGPIIHFTTGDAASPRHLAAAAISAAGASSFVHSQSPEPLPNQKDTQVGGTVPATLSLTLGANPSFGAFVPGIAKTYTASTTASVISTAADAQLTVPDPGHLMNGAFALPQPLVVSGVPKSYVAPVSNDPVTIGFSQAIGASDALRTGTYAKTLTFTLATTNP